MAKEFTPPIRDFIAPEALAVTIEHEQRIMIVSGGVTLNDWDDPNAIYNEDF